MTLKTTALIALSLVLAVPATHAAAPAKADKGAASSDKALADKAAAYLGGLKSAEAKFSQTDPRGAVTTGTFSLQRPGRARFAYDAPAALTVVADGVNVDVADGKLKTFDQYPQKNTPLSILLGDKVSFDKGVTVTAVTRTATGFTLTAKDAKKQAEGSITLTFANGPFALVGWTVVDAQGQKTTVHLTSLKTGVALSPSLFVLKDPYPHTFKP